MNEPTAKPDGRTEQVHESTEEYRAIFEAVTDGLVISDMDGYVVESNPAFCRMSGYTRDELIGMHRTALIGPDSLQPVESSPPRFRKDAEFHYQGLGVRRDGSVYPAEMHVGRFAYRGRPHMLAVARDITEQVQARDLLEQRVEERTRELKTLLEVSRDVASRLEMSSLLNLLLDGLQGVVPYDGAAVLGRRGEGLVYLARRAPTPAVESAPDQLAPEYMHRVVETIMRGEVVIIDDVRGDTPLARAFQLHAPDLMETRHSYIRCWMGVPMAIRDQWIGMLLLASGEANFYTRHHAGLALAVAQQAAVAMENARLHERAKELSVLEERQRLSRELHDSVSQALYGIGLAAETTRQLLERDPAQAARSNEMIRSLADSGMAEMRALLFELRPESLELEGLVAALLKQANALKARHNIPLLIALCEEPATSLPVKEALYRIAQEALHNAIKHAGPTHMALRLDCSDGEVVLEVEDDGEGFDPHGAFPGHLGLRSMHERVTSLGGTLEIESARGNGTCVRARLPCSGGA